MITEDGGTWIAEVLVKRPDGAPTCIGRNVGPWERVRVAVTLAPIYFVLWSGDREACACFIGVSPPAASLLGR